MTGGSTSGYGYSDAHDDIHLIKFINVYFNKILPNNFGYNI